MPLVMVITIMGRKTEPIHIMDQTMDMLMDHITMHIAAVEETMEDHTAPITRLQAIAHMVPPMVLIIVYMHKLEMVWVQKEIW